MPSKKPSRIAIVGADWPIYEKYCPNFTGMKLGLSAMGIEHQLFSCRPRLDIQAIIDYQPDFVLYGLIDLVDRHDWRKQIRNGLPDAKIVMWYGDLRNQFTGQIHRDCSEIDAMFVSNDAQEDFYKKVWNVPSCDFLPLGSPVWDRPIEERFDFDFVFIGGVITGRGFLERARIMWELRRRHGLKIIDGPPGKPDLRAKIMKQMPAIYRSAKISLDWSHFTDIQGYTSNRFWIVTGAGGFALTKRFPGCEEFYPEGTRAYFDTLEEAVELRDYYLEHPEEREKIRAAGHAHAAKHTYDKRFAIMFDIVYGKKSKNRLHGAGVSTSGTSLEENSRTRSSKEAQKTAAEVALRIKKR